MALDPELLERARENGARLVEADRQALLARAGCSFCGKRPNGRRALVTSSAGHVCTECLHVCREILGGRAA